jgi:hypothetical protein
MIVMLRMSGGIRHRGLPIHTILRQSEIRLVIWFVYMGFKVNTGMR